MSDDNIGTHNDIQHIDDAVADLEAELYADGEYVDTVVACRGWDAAERTAVYFALTCLAIGVLVGVGIGRLIWLS